jgi:hypothetical protein
VCSKKASPNTEELSLASHASALNPTLSLTHLHKSPPPPVPANILPAKLPVDKGKWGEERKTQRVLGLCPTKRPAPGVALAYFYRGRKQSYLEAGVWLRPHGEWAVNPAIVQ